MAFVTLDQNGNIAGIYANAQTDPSIATVVISDNDGRVVAFLSAAKAALIPQPTLTFLQFMALFTPTEQVTIVNSTDTQVKLFLLMATGTGSITLANPEVATGVNYLVSVNLLTPDRATAILANQPPI